MLSDSLGRVNSRQEGKLTHGARNRNGKAEGMSGFRVFLAIHDQYVFLPGGRSPFGDEMYFTFTLTFTLDIGRPLRLTASMMTVRVVAAVLPGRRST